MSRITLILTSCLLLVAAGCTAGGDDASPVAEVVSLTLNSKCPIMGGDVEPEGGTFEYAGATIGFCCDGCSEDFAALDDAGKVAALAEAGAELPK